MRNHSIFHRILHAELLCPTTPIVAPSERVLRGLMQQYQQYDGDVTSVLQGLHVAHVLHHTGQPLACLTQVRWFDSACLNV